MRVPCPLSALSGLLLIGVALGGCAGPRERAAACPDVPALPAEAVPKPPVSEAPLVWQPGHWEWTSTSYAWQQGAWIPRLGSTNWMPGSWSLAPGGSCLWNPAHFV